MIVSIYDATTLKLKLQLSNLDEGTRIIELKKEVLKAYPHLSLDRQSIRPEPRAKALDDHDCIRNVKLVDDTVELQLYLKDLGPQVAWKTVFLAEYMGPFFIYPMFYLRLPYIYHQRFTFVPPGDFVVSLALLCWELHYAKRLYETLFVHRFSHGTMPVRNLFKNCAYYWLFAAFVAFHVNHPFYKPPSFGWAQILAGLVGFAIAEMGNYSIHTALASIRPPGSKRRAIPCPTSNPFTRLFNYVSVPNYTYEIMAWSAFSVMTQCLPAFIFTLCGAYQMTVWAISKHKAYKREFPTYPPERRAIIPFLV